MLRAYLTNPSGFKAKDRSDPMEISVHAHDFINHFIHPCRKDFTHQYTRTKKSSSVYFNNRLHRQAGKKSHLGEAGFPSTMRLGSTTGSKKWYPQKKPIIFWIAIVRKIYWYDWKPDILSFPMVPISFQKMHGGFDDRKISLPFHNRNLLLFCQPVHRIWIVHRNLIFSKKNQIWITLNYFQKKRHQ